MRGEIEGVLLEEERNLVGQGKKGENTIDRLKVHREAVLEHPQQDQKSRGFPGSMRIRTKEKIMNFLTKNAGTIPSSSEDSAISSEVQENEREDQSEVKAAEKEIEVEQTLKEDCACKEIDTELESSTMKIDKLNSEGDRSEERLLLKTSRVHKLEEELRLAKEIISIFSASVKGKLLLEEQISRMQRRLDNSADKDEQLVKMLQGICDELSSGSQEFESEESEVLASALVSEMSRLKGAAENSCRLEQERNMLENQAAVDKQSIKEMKSSLEIAEDTIRKLNEVKTEILEEDIELKRRKIEVLSENTRLTELMAQQAADNESNLKAAERKVIELQDKLELISTLQRDMELQTIELIEANVTIEELTAQKTSLLEENQELLSKTKRLEKLEKDLEFIEVHASHWDNYSDGLKQRVTFLEDKCEKLILKVQAYESIKKGVTPAALKVCCHQLIRENEDVKAQIDVLRRERDELLRSHAERGQTVTNMEENAGRSNSIQHQSPSDLNTEDESLLQQNKGNVIDNDDPLNRVESLADIQQEHQDLQIDSKKYFIAVSDPKFLKLDWKKILIPRSS